MGSVSWHSEFDHLDSLQEQGGVNLYACVNGDPLGYVDLDGRNPVAAAIAATTAAAARALLKKLLRDIAKKKAKDAAKKQAKSSKSKAKSGGKACKRKGRNKPPSPLEEAEGRPHSIPEKSGKNGQYTTHNGDGTWKQYRGSGQDHGGIPRPNVKETGKNVTPDGREFIDKGRVRPPKLDEIPGGLDG